jgi:putative transposase
MVTGGTYLKEPFFRGADRLDYLCEKLMELAEKYLWQLQAWAVFPNHYHFVAISPPKGGTLTQFTRHLHGQTAIETNRWDNSAGRHVRYQYWDTELTFERSYFARLGYVHKNAVHHGLVREPSFYPWCSAGWFQRKAGTPFYKTIMGMKIDRVQVVDDYTVATLDR